MKKYILILLMFIGIGANAQYNMLFDTVHFELGGQIYYQNSVTDTVFINNDTIPILPGLWEIDGTETQLITADEIDMQTKKIINVVDPTSDQDAATKKYHDDNVVLLYVKVSLDAAAVGNLGTAQTLIVKPNAGEYIEIVDMTVRINVSTTLEVGTQAMSIGYKIGGSELFNLTNTDVETATTKIFTLTPKGSNPQAFEADDIVAVLDGAANPSSGSVTMDFYIIYKIITL